MKRFIILALVLITAYQTTCAQLTVYSSGKVGVGTTGTVLSNLAINSTGESDFKLYTVGSQKGIHSNVNNSNNASNWGTSIEGFANDNLSSYRAGVHGSAYNNQSASGRAYGVLGRAGGGSSSNYAIFGQLVKTTNGAAIYGTATATDFGATMDKRYAGYFAGPVKITGDLTVNGNFNGMLLSQTPNTKNASTAYSLSDNNGGRITSLLTGIEALGYYCDNASLKSKRLASSRETQFVDSDSVNIKPEISIIERQIQSKQHYGLDAEQLEEVFPDLVYENEDGTKSINYVEMVPILVQAINELSAKVEALESGNGSAKKIETRTATNVDEMGENVTLLALGQNKPNPFGTSTSIEVSIPDDVKSAFIYVYDLTGKKLQQIDITARGKQTVTINASTLTDGMYLYSLIADGKVAETRRMIVEK